MTAPTPAPDLAGLVERLEKYIRPRQPAGTPPYPINPDGPEAARAIRDLEAENARLSEALNKTARAELLHLMEEISEDHWCAGWMSGLEFDLWIAAHADEDYKYGMSVIDKPTRAALARLSQEAGGWWAWGDEGRLFLTTEEWLSRRAALSGRGKP